MTSISIIIPAGRPELLTDLVRALLDQDIDFVPVEIVVVTPRQGMDLQPIDERIRFVFTDRLFSPGKMRNIGASHAAGDYLAFIDDDCIPGNDWLRRVLKTFEEHDQNGCVGCRVTFPERGFWAAAADYSLFACYQYGTKREICLGSAAILTKRDIYREIGGFDEHLRASEDWDFCLKILETGRRCVFESAAEISHRHGCTSLKSIVKKAYRYGYDSGLIVQNRHRNQMSWLARLSLALASPALYWLLIVPYALLVTVLQSVDFLRFDPRYPMYLPVVFLGKFVYHIGVWRRLMVS